MAAASSSILDIAATLGTPVPSRPGQNIVDTLVPTDAETAHPRSLSATYGRNALPFHTDSANWPTPCRYVLLSCPLDRQHPTLLLPWSSVINAAEKAELASAVFFVRSGRGSFYTTAFDAAKGFLRFDPGCMRAATPSSVRIAEEFLSRIEKAKPHVHAWASGDLLIIDNWRILHARPPWPIQAGHLERVLVTT